MAHLVRRAQTAHGSKPPCRWFPNRVFNGPGKKWRAFGRVVDANFALTKETSRIVEGRENRTKAKAMIRRETGATSPVGRVTVLRRLLKGKIGQLWTWRALPTEWSQEKGPAGVVNSLQGNQISLTSRVGFSAAQHVRERRALGKDKKRRSRYVLLQAVGTEQPCHAQGRLLDATGVQEVFEAKSVEAVVASAEK